MRRMLVLVVVAGGIVFIGAVVTAAKWQKDSIEYLIGVDTRIQAAQHECARDRARLEQRIIVLERGYRRIRGGRHGADEP